MHRILVDLGPIKVYSYGFMLMLGFAAGIVLAVVRGRRRGIPAEFILDLSTMIVFSAIIGARAVYVLFHGEGYWPRWWDVFKVWEGGLTVYGGVLLAVVLSILFCRRRSVPFLRVADTMAPSLALGVGITRVGCFLNGCCFGEPCQCSWAVRFPPGSMAEYALGPVAVHPAQLYASAVGFIAFVVVLLADRVPRREGFLFWLFVLVFAAATFFTDFTRHWETSALVFRGETMALSVNQVLELALAVFAGVMLARSGGGGSAGRRERADA